MRCALHLPLLLCALVPPALAAEEATVELAVTWGDAPYSGPVLVSVEGTRAPFTTTVVAMDGVAEIRAVPAAFGRRTRRLTAIAPALGLIGLADIPPSGAAPIPLDLRPSVPVSGIVLDGEGAPVAGLEVRYDPGDIETMTGPDGRFLLRFTPDGFVAGRVTVAPAGLGEPLLTRRADHFATDPVVRLAELWTIRGRLRFADGAPCPGGTLYRQRPDGPAAIADRKGRFILHLAGRSHADLTVTAPGAASRTVSAAALVDGQDIVLDRGRDLAVTVLDDHGAPCPGARVRAFEEEHGASTRIRGLASADTGADGVAVLPGLPLRALRVEALAGGGRRGEAPTARSEVADSPPEGPGALTLRVVPVGPPLTGRVVFADGTPCPGVRVCVRKASARRRDSKVAETAPDGRFTLPAMELGRLDIEVRPDLSETEGAGGCACVAEEVTREFAGTEISPIVVRTPRSLAGRVLVAGGRPLAGATILVAIRDLFCDGRGPRTSEPIGGYRVGVRTDADGCFLIGVPPAPAYDARVLADGFESVEFELTPGRPRDVVVPACAAVEGMVRDERGRAVVGAMVTISPDSPGWFQDDATTGLDGGFRLFVARGRPVRVEVDGAAPVNVVAPARIVFTVSE